MHPFLYTTLWMCFLFYIVCNVDGGDAQRGKPRGRIKGGETTSIEQFPWTVSLTGFKYGNIQCGGSIIDRKWVLTAAHCIDDKPWWVTPGKTKGKSSSFRDRYYIKRSYKHPTYQQVKDARGDLVDTRDDIALIELKSALRMTGSVRQIPISRKNVQAGQQCETVGWGLSDVEWQPAKVLMKLNVRIGSCDSEVILVNPNDNICTQYSTSHTCIGDSGGPLMCKEKGVYVLNGVQNSGSDCYPDAPPGNDVFTKVASYMEWIERTTRLDLGRVTEDRPVGRMYHKIANAGSGLHNGGNTPNLAAIAPEKIDGLPRPDELNDLDESYKLEGDTAQPEPRRPDVPVHGKRTSRLDNHDGAPMSTNSASMSLNTSKIVLFVCVPIFIIGLIVLLVVATVWIQKSSNLKKDILELNDHLSEPSTK